MTLYKWSQTASADASADSTINWAEGMSPAGVNDSGRAMMAAMAKFRDDITGAIVTGGTSTAYTVLSYQQFDSLPHLDGKEIAFTPHTTNGAIVILSVDGLGDKPLRSASVADLLPGVLVQGTPYVAVCNNADGAFYLHGFFGASPYRIPLGGMIDFIGTAAPNSFFALPFGQAISRATYATLFAMVGTAYGVGDGTTTFNLPDLRGRVVAGKDDMGGVAAGQIGSVATDAGTIVGTTLGSKGGSATHALTVGEHATLTPTGTVTVAPAGGVQLAGSSNGFVSTSYDVTGGGVAAVNSNGVNVSNVASLSGSNSLTTTGTGGATGAAHTNLQPTIITNKLLRII